MSQVDVKELKNRLTHYLRRTQKGEEIVVTDRGRPIALLQQIEAGKPGTREARSAQLTALAKIIPPTRVPSKRLKPLAYRGPSVGRAVIGDREDW
ncbi:MAG: type II toxin-antitoxin system prevent-host-death family antitoxin [Nitrospira sp.]|nr:type II toxin-antitoxin system prevent-host-death family antitoxin [Nitrospira sp.]